jgi:hypothetical protein
VSRYPVFNGIDEHRRDVETGLVGDLLETGGAGNVHLGQEIADHVQSYQQQPTRGQYGAEGFGDLAVALGQRLRDTGAAGVILGEAILSGAIDLPAALEAAA